MTKIILSLSTAGALLALGLTTVPAHAATQTWVSGHGTDSGACGTVAAPCRTFAHAIGLTTANGEIDVLDPANYGAVTINKSISIANDGVGDAVIQPGPGGIAITINAGAGSIVHLRGMTLEGAGVASAGIAFASGAFPRGASPGEPPSWYAIPLPAITASDLKRMMEFSASAIIRRSREMVQESPRGGPTATSSAMATTTSMETRTTTREF